jgi:hypothetical protein
MKTIQLARQKQNSQDTSRNPQNNAQNSAQNNAQNNSSQNNLPKPLYNSPSGDPQRPSQNRRFWSANQKICCCYVNNTARFQIVRIADTEATRTATSTTSGLVERTVLPYASILFEANLQDHLEVHTGNLMTSIHSDTIPCYQLAHPNP